ncbi:hypothetical protein [Anaerotignum propionicum]|uniref:hypothetical protein n=1 Tax=Anaerotignum propionicum TaxID=28446 RepID=UPI00210A8030|nr:hypothetical protein [Anaerotignum propionicum]MCQ4936643.1 hypothetical protein [Anaerotignum propionicum]
MKKLYMILFICCLVFFSGCGNVKPSETAENPPITLTNEKPKEKSVKTLHGKIIKIEKDMLFVAITEEKDICQVSTSAFIGDITQIEPGDMVEIGFSGMVLDIYPEILANPDYVILTEKSEDFVGLYYNILLDLFKTDPALNSDINLIAINLSEEENLTDSEKKALLYLLWNKTQIETRMATYDDLIAENLITIEKDTGFAQMENGIWVNLKSTKAEKDMFTFSVQKWRSSLGAYGFVDCTAKKEDGKWSYIVGGEMMS